MATSQNPYKRVLRELASLMLSVSGESVTLAKKSSPETALKMKPRDEWKIYLEFLKLYFNLADRCSALYIPVKDQPAFMDSLEDEVAESLKGAMVPMLGSAGDPMEIVVTVGSTAAESRQLYERFKFLITENTKEKEACFAVLGDRIAEAMGKSGDGMVTSSAILCSTAIVPAMKTLFERLTTSSASTPGTDTATAGAAIAAGTGSAPGIGNEIKLVSVMSTIQGEEVETRWGLHPQFQQDLTPEENKQLSKSMNRVTQILGERYAAVAFSENWVAWHTPGHA